MARAIQAGVASQCQAVAGRAAALSSAESKGLMGLSLVPSPQSPACNRAARRALQVLAMAPKKKVMRGPILRSSKFETLYPQAVIVEPVHLCL